MFTSEEDNSNKLKSKDPRDERASVEIRVARIIYTGMARVNMSLKHRKDFQKK